MGALVLRNSVSKYLTTGAMRRYDYNWLRLLYCGFLVSLEFRVGIAVETVNGSGAKAFQLGIGEIGCFGVIQASMWLVL